MTDEEREDLNTFRHDLVKQARWWQWKAETLEKENEQLKAENAALRERLEKAATFALDMCSEDDCAGDGSVGLPPCDMWHAWDTDENGVNIESGCHLKEYLTELKGGKK